MTTSGRSRSASSEAAGAVVSHLLADVVTCGPGGRAVQWRCTCGAYGKPVPIYKPGDSDPVLGLHRRHARRAS